MKGKELLKMMGFALVTGQLWRHESTTMHLIENDETITPKQLIELIMEHGELRFKKQFRELIGAKHNS